MGRGLAHPVPRSRRNHLARAAGIAVRSGFPACGQTGEGVDCTTVWPPSAMDLWTPSPGMAGHVPKVNMRAGPGAAFFCRKPFSIER